MTPYRKKGHSSTWYITVVDRHKKPHRLSSGTHDLDTAKEMGVMLRTLARRGSRDWDLVAALLEKDPARPTYRRLTLERLYDHWAGRARDAEGVMRTLEDLRAELADVDLAPAIEEWLAYIERNRALNTYRLYKWRIARLAPLGADGARAPFYRSRLSAAMIAGARDRVPGGASSVSGHLTAWSSFFTYALERDLVAENPCERVSWPRPQAVGDRVRHIERLADVQRFVAAFPTLEGRAIAALRESTGADWDGLDPMRREHVVDVRQRLVFLPGDKTGNRAREVEVEPWAWAHVAAYLTATRDRLPGAKLFTLPYDTYKGHHKATRDALIAAGVAIPAGYTPHNARHSFAVRKRRLGWEDWAIARYLGNTEKQVREVYGRFTPTRRDLQQDVDGRRKAQGEQ